MASFNKVLASLIQVLALSGGRDKVTLINKHSSVD